MKPLVFAVFASCFAATTLSAETAADIIAKARAASGTEAALNAVRSLRYAMKLSDAEGKYVGAIVQEFKRPLKQRETNYAMKDKDGNGLEIVSASDGVEGFTIIRRPDNGFRKLLIMKADDVNSGRDLALANLEFFTPPPADRGTLVVAPDEKIDGVECFALDYQYKTGKTLRRYIEKTTGRFVANRVYDQGRSENLMINKTYTNVAGISFPDRIDVVDNAGKLMRILKMEKIEVNPTDIRDSFFATPLY